MNNRRKIQVLLILLVIGPLCLSGPRICYAQNENQSANKPAALNRNTDQPASKESEKIDKPEGGVSSVEDALITGSGSENESSNGGSWLSGAGLGTWTALGVVLALIVAAAFAFRKLSPGGRMFSAIPGVKVLGRTYLSPKQFIALIKIDQELLLVGVTEHNVTSLHTIKDPEKTSRMLSQIEQGKTGSVTGNFLNLFNNEQQSFDTENAEKRGLDNIGTNNDQLEQNFEEKSKESDDPQVSELKSEIKSLINKVNRLKGIGGQD